MYLVTAIRDIDEATNVEVAGIFNTPEKAFEAREKVAKWMEQQKYENYEVFVNFVEVNHLDWYEIEQYI